MMWWDGMIDRTMNDESLIPRLFETRVNVSGAQALAKRWTGSRLCYARCSHLGQLPVRLEVTLIRVH
jgi:hypothetical protein